MQAFTPQVPRTLEQNARYILQTLRKDELKTYPKTRPHNVYPYNTLHQNLNEGQKNFQKRTARFCEQFGQKESQVALLKKNDHCSCRKG